MDHGALSRYLRRTQYDIPDLVTIVLLEDETEDQALVRLGYPTDPEDPRYPHKREVVRGRASICEGYEGER